MMVGGPRGLPSALHRDSVYSLVKTQGGLASSNIFSEEPGIFEQGTPLLFGEMVLHRPRTVMMGRGRPPNSPCGITR